MKVKNTMRISVVTIVYNCVNTLEKTIQSVLSQTYSEIEYIIIDGQSDDGTMELIKKYETFISKIISERDKGISDAFNKGIQYCTGEYLIFLNAGDTFSDNQVISQAVRELEKQPVDILFYKVRVSNKIFIPAEKYNNDEIRIWNDCQVPHQGAFIHQNVFKNIGGFLVTLKIRMDFEFFARCRKLQYSHKYIPSVIIDYEEGGTSMKAENSKIFYTEGLGIKIMYGMKIYFTDWIYLLVPKWMREMKQKLRRKR